MTKIVENNRVHLHDEEPNHIHGGEDAVNNICKTQVLDMNAGMHTHMWSTKEKGGGVGWYETQKASLKNCSPQGKHTWISDVEEVVEEELLEMEVSLDDTEMQTQPPGRSMWVDFWTAMRDLPMPACEDCEIDEWCVRAKRAHGNRTNNADNTWGWEGEATRHNT